MARESLWERKRRVRERKGGALDGVADMHAQRREEGVRSGRAGICSRPLATLPLLYYFRFTACSGSAGSCAVRTSVVNTLKQLRQPPETKGCSGGTERTPRSRIRRLSSTTVHFLPEHTYSQIHLILIFSLLFPLYSLLYKAIPPSSDLAHINLPLTLKTFYWPPHLFPGSQPSPPSP